MCWFHFRSFQGVCDTPLRLFGWNLGFVGLRVGFIFARFRAYAIRPYTCSVEIWAWLGNGLVSFSLTWGRMRYAPTPIRLKSGLCWGDGWVSFSLSSGRMRYAPTLVRWKRMFVEWKNHAQLVHLIIVLSFHQNCYGCLLVMIPGNDGWVRQNPL